MSMNRAKTFLSSILHAGMVEGAGMQPGMMYMPLSPHGLSPHSLGHPQQQWPAMMPWMGPYFMHPSQHAQPEPINLMSAGRSVSAPDNPASLSWASQPMQTSGIAAAAAFHLVVAEKFTHDLIQCQIGVTD